MAGPSTREAGPRESDPAGTSGTVTAVPSIVVLLVLGLALRIIIAYVLLPGSGFPNDRASFLAWGNDIATRGPMGFYDGAGFLDYPPVILLLLGVVARLTMPFGGMGDAFKLIPIFADAVLAFVVWQMALELGASRRGALLAAGFLLFNPVTLINSSIWGQVDAVGATILLLGLRELMADRRETAAALAVLATLTKIQLGILVFLVGFVVLRRSLLPPEGTKREPLRVLSSLGAGVLTGVAICLPFVGFRAFDTLGGALESTSITGGEIALAAAVLGGLGLAGLAAWLARDRLPSGPRFAAAFGAGTVGALGLAAVRFDPILVRLGGSFGEYPYLTVNAFNPWALVTSAGNAMMRTHAWIPDSPKIDDQTGRAVSYVSVGPFSATFLTVVAALVVLLLAVAVIAWLYGARSRFLRSAAAEEAGVGDLEPDEDEGLPWWRAELRGAAGACLVAAVALAVVLAAGVLAKPPAAFVGEGLLLATLVGVSLWAAWRADRRSLLVALAILAIAFFALPTRSHERYLFPFFGVGAVLLAISRRWLAASIALSIANAANLLAVLVAYDTIPDVRNAGSATIGLAHDQLLPGFGSWLNDVGGWLWNAQWPKGIIWPIAAASIASGLALAWALLQMRPRAIAALAFEAAGAGGVPEGTEAARRGGRFDLGRFLGAPGAAAEGEAAMTGAAGWSERRATGGAAFAGDAAAAYGELDDFDADFEPEPALVPGRAVEWWRRLARRPIRPDRSASLDNEPHGRLDRLDLWLVVALVITVLTMRGFRLGEPAKMYFDEVYHARTGAEFLQDWRYDIPRKIYEWTHPHFAKYAIAAGITVFSDYKVNATSDLGVPVKDAVVEPRAVPGTATTAGDARADPGARLGDRVYVATTDAVVAFDLQTRAQVARYPVPGVSALALAPPDAHTVYAATSDGHVYRIDTASLDYVRLGKATAPSAAALLPASAGFPIARVFAPNQSIVLVADTSGHVASIDPASGKLIGAGQVPGLADVVDAASSQTSLGVIADQVTDAKAEAALLASAAGSSAGVASIEQALTSSASPGLEVALNVPLSSAAATKVTTLISDGKLPGIVLTSAPEVVVAYRDGLAIMDGRHLTLAAVFKLDSPATSAVIGRDGNIYAAAGSRAAVVDVAVTPGKPTTFASKDEVFFPAPVTRLYYDRASEDLHALGKTPKGDAWTTYAVETSGNSVITDARLPFQPVAWGGDVTDQLPSTDREALLTFAADGRLASTDIGQFSFSWRIMGVLFGALMAACLYLLARVLFRRRSVGLLVAAFTVLDGMFFAQARIAMNDTYVGAFLLLAYLLFALLWTGTVRSRSWFWLLMPVLGVVLGLALAAKWVALYAIASIGILILIRSALGRVITILGLAVGTGVLGHLALVETPSAVAGTGNSVLLWLLIGAAIAAAVVGARYTVAQRTAADRTVVGVATGVVTAVLLLLAWSNSPQPALNGGPNYTFFLIMLATTMIAAAANAYHPVAWTMEEVRFAIGAPIVAGVLASLAGGLIGNGTLTLAGVAGFVGGIAIGAFLYVVGMWGFGPLAPPPAPDDPSSLADPPSPAPEGWLRLGSGFGLPAVWMIACLLVLPIGLYVASYVPWAMPWQQQTEAAQREYSGPLPVIVCFGAVDDNGYCPSGDGWPAGHTGKTLIGQTEDMYTYHNTLRATHAASSPWWAWPMDLKPVWFESIGYAEDTGSMIYDGGNLTLWWLAIPAFMFACWQAFKRRSLGLALIGIAFFWQWLSWARIDRASFQYHFYTALPFFLLALAYFVAELWHGPSRRTWLLARVGAAAALVAAPLLWLARPALCGLARVDLDPSHEGYDWRSQVCGALGANATITWNVFLIAVVLVGALVALGLILWRIERRQAEGGAEPEGYGWLLQLAVPIVVAGALMVWIGAAAPQTDFLKLYVTAEFPALVLIPLLALLAVGALMARDPRRFVLGILGAGAITFAVLYPNLSALPMPGNIASIYNGALPTWLYGFQFGINEQADAANIHVVGTAALELAGGVLLVAIVAAYVAWVRRVIVGYRRRRRLLAALGVPVEAQGTAEGAG